MEFVNVNRRCDGDLLDYGLEANKEQCNCAQHIIIETV